MEQKFAVLSKSQHSGSLEPKMEPAQFFMARFESDGKVLLGVRTELKNLPFNGFQFASAQDRFFNRTAENAAFLRTIFPWLNPTPMKVSAEKPVVPSFGFGDRLGLATPGHIRALRSVAEEGAIYPIFAQQSVRENARTGRTPQQVMDDATWAVFEEGWHQSWGGDADHLKKVDDLPAFVSAGYTFFTVDPGEYVDPAADTDDLSTLESKIAAQPWRELGIDPVFPDELVTRYEAFCELAGWSCPEADVVVGAQRAVAKYGQAVLLITLMYRALAALKPGGFDFEVSVDETDTPTTLLEHFYIASELNRLQVEFSSLAPRFPGRFEKGVDYIGNLTALEPELEKHATIMRHFGGYRISLHSGSDKFSVYPILAKYTGPSVHVKTAGTSYLEALRVAAKLDPTLFRQVLGLARERYTVDRLTYHVSADENRLPDPLSLPDAALPALLDDFHVRQALHVTFGSALAQYGDRLKGMLQTHPGQYADGLTAHFVRHLQPLVD